jgi:membrane protease YdiL (CAAX protease family)
VTSLIESGSDAASERSQHGPSQARAFWLLVRLRLTRWSNRRQLGVWSGFAASSATNVRRRATQKPLAVARALLWPAVFVAFLCWQSYRVFAGIVRDHGVEALQGTAVLLSCANILGLLLLAVLGSRAWDAQGDDDADWLATLPAPAWVLHTAKIAEAAFWSPGVWGLIFPFFTGLGLHAGLGLLAPLLALVIALPTSLAYAVLGSVIDLVSHAWARSRLFRVLRFLLPLALTLVMLVWMTAPALMTLSRPGGLLKVGVDPFGGWLDFSADLVWLPFSEPARALLSLREAPLAGLAWLAAFALEMIAVTGVGLLVLRKAHCGALEHGRVSRRTTPGAHVARQRSLSGRLGPVIAKDLRWLWRNPSRSGGILLNLVMFNGLGMLFVSRLPGLDPSSLPGVALFGVGVMLVFAIGTLLLELEQPALWQWAALPRSIASVLAHKALLAAALAVPGALPAALYALRSAPSVHASLPGLLYGVTCILILAFAQAGLWLRRVSASAMTSPLAHALRLLKLLVVVGILGIGFSPRATTETMLPIVVLIAAFFVGYLQTSVERLPFALDPSSHPSATMTATFAIIAIFLTRSLQVGLNTSLLRSGSSPSQAATVAVLVAGGVGLAASSIWLSLRGVSALRERLGLGAGKGLRIILREGVLWSLPAIAVNQAYWLLIAPRVVQSSAQVSQQQTVMQQLAGSSLAVVAVGAVAVPVIEELLFRGMLYRALRAGWSLAISVIVASAVFVVDHTLTAALPIAFGSICITLAFERSRSLYAAMLVHALYNGFLALLIVLG